MGSTAAATCRGASSSRASTAATTGPRSPVRSRNRGASRAWWSRSSSRRSPGALGLGRRHADLGLGAGDAGPAPERTSSVRWEIDVEAGCAASERGGGGAAAVPRHDRRAPGRPGLHLAWPPRASAASGLPRLVAGATLYLPVAASRRAALARRRPRPQATARWPAWRSMPARARPARLVLQRPAAARAAPDAEASVAFRLRRRSLERAAREGTTAMVDVLAQRYETSRAEALVLASVAANLRITQMVNGVSSVRCVLPRAAIRRQRPRSTPRWLPARPPPRRPALACLLAGGGSGEPRGDGEARAARRPAGAA